MAAVEILAGLLGTGATGLLGYTAAKVVSLHREVGVLASKVGEHIDQHESFTAGINEELADIKKRLPNGELPCAHSDTRHSTF